MEAERERGTRGQIGQYLLTERIGAGSFAVVYKAKHVSRGHVVAIKEIVTDWLHEKLIQGLYSEIQILQKISHPNIVRLHDIVRAPDRIFLVLEYCAGGDLAAYIQQHKRVSQAVARKIMRQLGAGLEVLRANNLIHRDLKPQNLLLSTNDDGAVLKIADFGFARSLQPQGLAETHCGSPLYMAPEILQYQKYDAKADLWSVGAILYQLVTGHPPFSGSSHTQLMKNIRKTLHFPGSLVTELHPDCVDLCRKLLCQNPGQLPTCSSEILLHDQHTSMYRSLFWRGVPVERLSFEEFFNHPFIRAERVEKANVLEASSVSQKPGRAESLLPFADGGGDVFNSALASPPQQLNCTGISMPIPDTSREGTLNASPQDGAILDLGCSLGLRSTQMQPTLNSKSNKSPAVDFKNSGLTFLQRDSTRDGEDSHISGAASRGGTLMDSMECIEREYVLVNTPLTPTETVLSLSGGERFLSKGEGSPQANFPYLRVPGPAVILWEQAEYNLHMQAPGRPSVSTKKVDVPAGAEGPPSCARVRLTSLQQSARVIADLAVEKSHAGQPLAAFSLHLVCLSIWKEALHVCHTWAAAAAEGERFHAPVVVQNLDPEAISENNTQATALSACAAVEQEYVAACEHGEALAKHLTAIDAHDGVPDAIELIFQAALLAGRNAAVGEVLGNMLKASMVYAKSAALFHFLLEVAPLLPLKPPLVLTSLQKVQLREIAHRVAERQAKCVANRLMDTP